MGKALFLLLCMEELLKSSHLSYKVSSAIIPILYVRTLSSESKTIYLRSILELIYREAIFVPRLEIMRSELSTTILDKEGGQATLEINFSKSQ